MNNKSKFKVGDFVKVRNPSDGLDFYGIVVKIAVSHENFKVLRADSSETIKRCFWYKSSRIKLLARA